MEQPYTVTGQIIDLADRRIFPGEVTVEDGKIKTIVEIKREIENRYILPGFIDAHVHIESSMLVPAEFARLAVRHGTVATVSDPHEIANVLGMEGVDYMIENGRKVPFKFYFGAPSCVPATPFETAGAEIGEEDIRTLLARPEIHYLSEMMNWPGVLRQDPAVMRKIELAAKAKKPVDGHAPGLKGEDAEKYAAAGISTDHESYSQEEALDKLAAGMKILIREGSAARNYEALHPLIAEYSDRLMFCSDDKHPDDLISGHIGQLVRLSLEKGYDLFDVLQIACVNPVRHYDLEVGLLRPGDPADFIVVEDLTDFSVKSVYICGEEVYDGKEVLFPRPETEVVNRFREEPIRAEEIEIRAENNEIRVIEAESGQLITRTGREKISRDARGNIAIDPERDILKIIVVNRYEDVPPAVGFVRGFGMKNGAIASSVAHDSHNIIAVGATDEALTQAVNALIREKGGICVITRKSEAVTLPLPVAGLMSPEPGEKVAEEYEKIDAFAKALGSTLEAPFMTLSFMALLVIPELKLSDKGLFDGKTFEFVDLFFQE